MEILLLISNAYSKLLKLAEILINTIAMMFNRKQIAQIYVYILKGKLAIMLQIAQFAHLITKTKFNVNRMQMDVLSRLEEFAQLKQLTIPILSKYHQFHCFLLFFFSQ